MSKIQFSPSKLTSQKLAALATTVVDKLTGNPAFPNIAAKVAALTAAKTAMIAAEDAVNAARATFSEKSQDRLAATDALRRAHLAVVNAVESDADGDPVKLASSGYALVDDPAATTEPPAMIQNFAMTAGDGDGEMDFSWDKEPDALTYELQITETVDVAASWVTKALPTKSSYSLEGLPSGHRIWGRVRGIGVMGPGAWSDPATKTVP